MLLAELDVGEASVIQCAKELSLSNVIIDERRARRIPGSVYALNVRGTCALLLEAKKRGLIEAVGPPMETMMAGGYFIGPRLKSECLSRAGE